MAIKEYTKQYVGMFPNIFSKKARFLSAFGGTIQVVDGITDATVYMDLKISNDVDAVLQEYNTGENVAFGSGTGNSNRFGERKEIKSVNKQVNFDSPLAIHEGVDNFTVNDVPNQVIAERQAKHAEAWTEKFSQIASKALSTAASETLSGTLNEDGLTKLFNDARKKLINNNVSKDIVWRAYVTADVYNLLVDSKLATTTKKSSVNIDENELYKFKGFVLEEYPDVYFQSGEQVYFVADGVGQMGLGVQTSRALDATDFVGIVLQAAGKPAKYIPEKNAKAILKAKLSPAA
ncbi:capsid protein [Parabacteroides distasonis]|uniref:Capsid protein n=3 Tax=Pseudomonadati TaxID=3379134 RepID=A0A7K0GNZ8_PARDI|nr:MULTISPECIES: capsid protein [Bacteria]MTN58651.1 capsid protein [Turicibacter sanguinis]KAB5324038.1 capsid protein [Bacteroides stercoris]MRY60417.1 capsid protein [Parabacteroides distasonis]MRY69677.1 capsid protein [Parabacteroides distasonis]MSA77405.1 capsid protein [Parabacteroides distasonis]